MIFLTKFHDNNLFVGFYAAFLLSGTKFHQPTQVCHHDRAVKCNDEVTDDPADVVHKSVDNITREKTLIPPATKSFVELTNNFIGRKPTSSQDDSIRFKREKLTEIVLTTEKPPQPSVIQKIEKKKKSEKNKKIEKQNIVKSSDRFRKTKEKERRKILNLKKKEVVRTVKEEAIKEVKLDDEASEDNCEGELCKSSKLRKKNIRENTPKLVHNDEDESSNNLNVKPTQPDFLISPNLVNDNIISREDPLPQNPIKSDSESVQNNTKVDLQQQHHSNVSSPEKPSEEIIQKSEQKLGYRTKPLDKLPFSRVIAAQKKSLSGEFSPYISFPELLTNITKSSRTVRY